jgi:hypothetical protein
MLSAAPGHHAGHDVVEGVSKLDASDPPEQSDNDAATITSTAKPSTA